MKEGLFYKILTEKVYLYNDVQGMVMRTVPADREKNIAGQTFFRFSGKKEFMPGPGNSEDDLAYETMQMGEEITEEEYYNF
jgi:hypothetical protein